MPQDGSTKMSVPGFWGSTVSLPSGGKDETDGCLLYTEEETRLASLSPEISKGHLLHR